MILFLDVTIDKPHNMYMQFVIFTGGISFIAFLVMVGMYINKVTKCSKENILVRIIAAGVVGFLISGFFNDSTICIMPMFYGFLGMGIALSLVKE